MREIGFPWSKAMADAHGARSAPPSPPAARLCRKAWPPTSPAAPTTPSADKGGGFCVFNDAAVAARLMQAEHAARSAGGRAGGRHRPRRPPGQRHRRASSATTPRSSRSRCTAQKNFPFRKEPSDLDVDLPDGCGDDDYLHALERALDELAQRFEPGLVIYLAGADPHEGDRLGRLKLTWDGLEARDRRVFDWAWQRAHAAGLRHGRRLRRSASTTRCRCR